MPLRITPGLRLRKSDSLEQILFPLHRRLKSADFLPRICQEFVFVLAVYQFCVCVASFCVTVFLML